MVSQRTPICKSWLKSQKIAHSSVFTLILQTCRLFSLSSFLVKTAARKPHFLFLQKTWSILVEKSTIYIWPHSNLCGRNWIYLLLLLKWMSVSNWCNSDSDPYSLVIFIWFSFTYYGKLEVKDVEGVCMGSVPLIFRITDLFLREVMWYELTTPWPSTNMHWCNIIQEGNKLLKLLFLLQEMQRENWSTPLHTQKNGGNWSSYFTPYISSSWWRSFMTLSWLHPKNAKYMLLES